MTGMSTGLDTDADRHDSGSDGVVVDTCKTTGALVIMARIIIMKVRV
jgi:hypothetical protein